MLSLDTWRKPTSLARQLRGKAGLRQLQGGQTIGAPIPSSRVAPCSWDSSLATHESPHRNALPSSPRTGLATHQPPSTSPSAHHCNFPAGAEVPQARGLPSLGAPNPRPLHSTLLWPWPPLSRSVPLGRALAPLALRPEWEGGPATCGVRRDGDKGGQPDGGGGALIRGRIGLH